VFTIYRHFSNSHFSNSHFSNSHLKVPIRVPVGFGFSYFLTKQCDFRTNTACSTRWQGGKRDSEALHHLQQLRDEHLPKSLSPDAIIDYEVVCVAIIR
jgi:hypothetical protein